MNNICVPSKTDDLNKYVFDTITEKSKEINSNQMWNNNKCWCGSKKQHICEKEYFWNLATCSCQHGQYLASIGR